MTSRRYPQTIGTNVRDIVDLIRREVSARSLGHTTIRIGEGAITLRSADGKTVLGQLGHLPNGQMGFSMDFRGAVQDIRNGFTEDSERISAVDRKAIKNADDIGKVGTWATNAQTTANNAHTRIDAVDNKTIKNAGDIQKVGTWASNAQTTANAASNAAGAAQTSADRAGVWATNAQKTANDANNNANSAHSRIDAVDRKAISAQGTADDARTRAMNAQSSANNAYDRADQASSRASSALSDAAVAKGRADQANQGVANIVAVLRAHSMM